MKVFFLSLLLLVGISTQAQTVDEILENYFEATGGIDNWRSLKGLKILGEVKISMPNRSMEMEMTTVQLNDGRQYTAMNMQGNQMKQNVWDGKELWGTNFMTRKAERVDAELAENFKKNEINDFPSPFLDYDEKGYSVELIGEETVEGVETYKVKLIKKPIMVNGVEEANEITYFFDKESFVPIAMESSGGAGFGPMRRRNNGPQMVTISDYQEVEGLYFPFTTGLGSMGEMTVKEIMINPDIPDAEFTMPIK